MTGVILISGHIHASFRQLRFIRKWDLGMAIHPEDKTSYTTQYQVAFLKYVANEYCAKHRRLSVMKPKNIPLNNLFPSSTACGSGQCSFDPYDLSSKEDGYWTPEHRAEMTPR